MRIAYVAGPFRATNAWDQEQNIRLAECMALTLWRKGYAVICPHTNTRFFQGVCPDETWLEGDLEILRRCDLVVMTFNWHESEGARGEKAEAERFGIPVFVGDAPMPRELFPQDYS